MQTTTNFNLNKPEGTDIYNIQNENDNMDIIDAALDKAHSTDDAASTDLVDGDYIPFYDTSATAKKKALWSTIVAKLKNIFPLGSTLAPIANGPKYPGTWSAGKQFVYQGQLCKTKVNVSSSDDINVGVSGNAELASDVTSQISNLGSQVNTMNIQFIIREYADNVVTGTTGNVALGIANDGFHFVTGAIVLGTGTLAYATPFVSEANNVWYLKIRNVDTNETINNANVGIRYLHVELKSRD